MRRKLTPRETALLILLLILALGSAYYLLFYTPTTQEIETTETRIADTLDQISADQLRLAQKQQMQEELDAIFAADPDPVSMAPYDNSRNVMHELNAILENTQDYSLSFASVTVDEDSDVVRRDISLTYTSTGYSAALDILQKLHDSQYRCLLNNVAISLKERSHEGGWWYNLLMGSVDSVPDTETSMDEYSDVTVTATLTFFEYTDGPVETGTDNAVQWKAPAQEAYAGPEVPDVEEGYSGWMQNRDGLYFYFRDGQMVTDEWITGRYGQWYYIQLNGVMATGFTYVSNASSSGFFYFATGGNDEGAMLTGWQNISEGNAGWFETAHNGHYGSCTYTDAWGEFKDYRPVV